MAANAIPVIPRCLYVLCSPLLGYGVSELLSRIPDSSHVLAIESSQEIFALCSPYIPNTLSVHPQLSMYRLSNEASLHSVLKNLGLWRFRHVLRVDLNNGPGLSPEIYQNLLAFTENALATYWRNRNALGVLGRHWVRHLFANLAALPRIVPFSAAKPVLIAGAGPSLDTAIQFISQMREKLTVLAVDTALGALLESGIEPDVVCVLETQCWNHLDFHNAHNADFVLAADLTSYPGSVALAERRIFPFVSEFTPLQFLERLKQTGVTWIPPLGSVGLAAVYLALQCSKGPVFLAGLDFAYVPGKTHGRGTSMHIWQLSHINRTDPTPGWQATMQRPRCKLPIPTDKVLAGYAEMFRNNFSQSDRLYMISGGMDLCIPHVTAKQAGEILANAAAEKQGPVHPLPVNNARQPIMDFLQAEMELLEKAISVWDKYSRALVDAEAVAHQLKPLDHLYCDFPDEPPLPKTDEIFLFRAIARCRELVQYMKHLYYLI